ncbi:UDP-glycosyltransferase 89B2-like [Salvia divinorum]|uniref:Glycosyltransferase n=1 Tax=Salvia divinorum TaxID=28513 RepID=A0ABD1FQH3_SALDI
MPSHVLVFPYPAQGHMIPLLDLTDQLAARGVTVTILVTPKNLRLLSPLLSVHPHSINPLVLPFPPHPAIPAGVENTIDLPASGFRHMMCALAGLRDPILHWFRGHPSPPSAVIFDMFLGWTNHLAADLGLRGYAFFPSGAFAISFIHSLWRQMPQAELVGFPEIPSSPIYPWWQLSPVFRSYIKGDPDSEFIRDSYLANFEGQGLVFNSFDEMEGAHLEYLANKFHVWAVGPLLPPDHVTDRGGSSAVIASEVCSWLDTCQDHSVVYVCFGSQAVLTNEQMSELASGLEKSGVRFILSVKSATLGHHGGGYGSIPEGFEARVAGRGLVIKGWAPQVPILRHKALRAFLTHCGWNSTLESIVAGVPMLVWPMGADQYLNATLLVEQLDVAIRVCEGPTTVLDSDELVRVLGQVASDKWSEKRARAVALSKAAEDAMRIGGRPFKNLDNFAGLLAQK